MNYLTLKNGGLVDVKHDIDIIVSNVQGGKPMFSRTPIMRTAEGKYLWVYDEDSCDEIKGTSMGAFKRTINKKSKQ